MEEDRTRPVAGALFAVNMLAATEGGGTFTLAELREDLAAVGFAEVALARQDEAMNAVVVAKKPGAACRGQDDFTGAPVIMTPIVLLSHTRSR